MFNCIDLFMFILRLNAGHKTMQIKSTQIRVGKTKQMDEFHCHLFAFACCLTLTFACIFFLANKIHGILWLSVCGHSNDWLFVINSCISIISFTFCLLRVSSHRYMPFFCNRINHLIKKTDFMEMDSIIWKFNSDFVGIMMEIIATIVANKKTNLCRCR